MADLLPTLTLMKLADNGLDLKVETVDQVGWLSASGKKFRVSFTYKLEAKWNLEDRWVGWKLIWILRVAQRVRLFIWKYTHDRLPQIGSDGLGECQPRQHVKYVVGMWKILCMS